MYIQRCPDRAALAPIFLLMFTLACDREPGILIDIASWPDGAERIRVRTKIEEVMGTDFFLNKDQTRFAVRVPTGSQGTVYIDAVGLDPMGCKLASGSLMELVPDNLSAFVERTLILSPVTSTCPFMSENIQLAGGLYSVAVGDFDNDMKPDLAVANNANSHVYVLHGRDTGMFYMDPIQDDIIVDNSKGLSAVAVGDFNGDTKPDLAITNYDLDHVTVLLRNGMGGFSMPTSFPVGSIGSRPYSVAVADFNSDMKPDLAVANYGGNNVTVLLGDGMGGFRMPAKKFSVGDLPVSVAVADFNSDMKLDLAVVNSHSNNVSVLLGDGTGGFSVPASNFSVGSSPASVAVADFNGDKVPDLAVTNAGDADNSVPPNVTVLLGNGVGRFRSTSIPLDLPCASVVAGYFNDGMKPDLALACANVKPTTNEVRVLLGNGMGGFDLASISSVGSNPISVAVGDFNGDMKPDLAVANFSSGDVSVLLNRFF